MLVYRCEINVPEKDLSGIVWEWLRKDWAVQGKLLIKMHQPTRACLFIRVSTEKQEYDRQISELNEYCAQKGYLITKSIATKITGTKTLTDRKDLQELLATAVKREFDKVIVSEISRIGRNARASVPPSTTYSERRSQ